jgi:uncharacterized protein YecT (DUF1311 family)
MLGACAQPTSGAASFDCRIAKTHVEKLICSDAELSRLDDKLGSAYKTGLKSALVRSALAADQRKWIMETRSRCDEATCLLRAYKARISKLENEISGQDYSCSVDESKLVGDWRRIKDGFFEEFSIITDDGERLFSSWLHHSPEYLGTWELKNCTLHIVNSNSEIPSLDYKVIGLKKDVLYLQGSDDGEKSAYRKIRR